jgi:hypothetical protein
MSHSARQLPKKELAWIFMTYGQGAEALKDLGVSQRKFWKLVGKGKPK